MSSAVVACPCVQTGKAEAVPSTSSLTAFPLHKGPPLLSLSQVLANFAESYTLERGVSGVKTRSDVLNKKQRQEAQRVLLQGAPPRPPVSFLHFHL